MKSVLFLKDDEIHLLNYIDTGCYSFLPYMEGDIAIFNRDFGV